jgi:transcriptional regulator with XRE-family HTH domain
MGRGVRRRPEYLGMKLRAIRAGLGHLSQGELIERLGLSHYIDRSEISAFERGSREPDLLTLKAYSDAAGVSVNDLIDDDVDLPKLLPNARQAAGLSGKSQEKPSRATANTTTVTLRLLIDSDDGGRRAESRARKTIEKVCLGRYSMKKLDDDEYELTFFYEDDEDLDDQVYTVLGAIYIEARRLKCSVKIRAREKGGDRYW